MTETTIKLPIYLKGNGEGYKDSTLICNLKQVFNKDNLTIGAGDSTLIRNLKTVYGGKPAQTAPAALPGAGAEEDED